MSKKILLADDDASVRKMVARVLQTAGYTPLLASSGSEAVRKFRSGQPDLVLLDLRMPEQGGWETFSQFNQVERTVPVIVITAWPNQYDEAVSRGIDALMEKPLDMGVLLEAIQQLLEESPEERSQRLADRNFTPAYLTPGCSPRSNSV